MSRQAIGRLAALAEEPQRTILGLMSGTSLDGLDLALCRLEGSGCDTRFSLERFHTIPYTEAYRRRVLDVFAQDRIDTLDLVLLNAIIGRTHARMILDTLDGWEVDPSSVDLVASHGQTVFHAPRSLHGRGDAPNATLQLGDGDHIAQLTGIITASDFRQKHIAAGGEGAPLAAYGDVLLMTDARAPRILLNVGGIANFTYLPPRGAQEKAFSTDIGPGNTMMDAYMRAYHPPATYDRDAELARQGTAHPGLLAALLDDPFLKAPFPKTTGPEHFSLERFETLRQQVDRDIGHADAMATLNRFSAEAVAEAVGRLPGQPDIFLSGGGARNPLLREQIMSRLPGHRIDDTRALGIDPDAKEAILFAVLANELVAGEPGVFERILDNAPSVSMGKISLPD